MANVIKKRLLYRDIDWNMCEKHVLQQQQKIAAAWKSLQDCQWNNSLVLQSRYYSSEPYALKGARTDLMGGKPAKAYLSNFCTYRPSNYGSEMNFKMEVT